MRKYLTLCLEWCASPLFASFSLLVLLLATLLAHQNLAGATQVLVVPFVMAGLALLANLWRHSRLAVGKTALAVCHLSLLVMICLIGVGRMTHLQGWVEVAVGEWFDGQLQGEERGAWHRGDLAGVAFRNDGFQVNFAPHLRRQQTRNQITWRDAVGSEAKAEIGDGQPLVLAGYHFLSSSNKGYAPMFVWFPNQGGEAVRGAVHLPSFPLFKGQSNYWHIPGTSHQLLTHLRFADDFPPQAGDWVFPGTPRHHLVMTYQGESWEMQPGERRMLADGVLLYQGLGSWMGYKVFYDWTMPWLLAASLVATFALIGYLVHRFIDDPWHRRWGEQGE